jgi:hypothetical protein
MPTHMDYFSQMPDEIIRKIQWMAVMAEFTDELNDRDEYSQYDLDELFGEFDNCFEDFSWKWFHDSKLPYYISFI